MGRLKKNKKWNVARYDENGELDDVVVSCDQVHIERLDNNSWWIGIYRKAKTVMFNLSTDSHGVNMMFTQDDIGLKDDTKRRK